MIVREALRAGRRLIEAIGSDEAELEAELLLRHVLRLDRVHLYQRLHDRLTPGAERRYRRLLDRRLSHEPTPYILGRKEFFGLDFEVSPAAIIPRPETEVLVELALAFARERFAGRDFTLADIGAGCGAIAVAIAHELPNARVIAIDVSKRALALARRNAERHGVAGRIDFRHGSLLAPLTAHPEPKPGGSRDSSRRADIIAANLPYVRTADWQRLPPEIREHEPRSGLDGGPDGLRLVRRLLARAPAYLAPAGALFAEIGDDQGAAAIEAAQAAFPEAEIAVARDLTGRDRVLVIKR
ncbi:MAG: peptide chain release factor N(5)-glutamine methyltransferase [Dehalococcoidia bacterium]|nr:peptide chain release factor N(5)-glutamine methyltransferase [Dehalococcoidia bacterium]